MAIKLRIYMQPYCRINRHDPFDIKITCFNNSSCKYGKNRYEMLQWCIPVTPLISERVLLKYSLNHISSGCYDKMPDWVGLNNKQFIFFLELWRLNMWVRVLVCSGSGDSSLPGLQRVYLTIFSHNGRRAMSLLFIGRPQSYWFRAPSL